MKALLSIVFIVIFGLTSLANQPVISQPTDSQLVVADSPTVVECDPQVVTHLVHRLVSEARHYAQAEFPVACRLVCSYWHCLSAALPLSEQRE